MDPRPQSHDRFAREVTLTPEIVGQFAQLAGDTNPIHHDSEFAALTRFKKLVASGTHTSALLGALTASHFSQYGAMLGLEFWYQYKRPVFADEKIRLEWLIISVRPSNRLNGYIVDLRGRILNELGQTAVGAKGRVLVVDQL
jgi:acyl dehydratase